MVFVAVKPEVLTCYIISTTQHVDLGILSNTLPPAPGWPLLCSTYPTLQLPGGSAVSRSLHSAPQLPYLMCLESERAEHGAGGIYNITRRLPYLIFSSHPIQYLFKSHYPVRHIMDFTYRQVSFQLLFRPVASNGIRAPRYLAAAPARLITCRFLPSHNSIRLTWTTRHSRPVTQSRPYPFCSLADKRQ